MISAKRMVKLHEEGMTATEIAAKHDLPVAMIWRELASHYERRYCAGVALTEDAARRIGKAEASARAAWDATALAEERAARVAQKQFAPDAEYRRRMLEIAREPSLARRLELAHMRLDADLAPTEILADLRTHKEMEA